MRVYLGLSLRKDMGGNKWSLLEDIFWRKILYFVEMQRDLWSRFKFDATLLLVFLNTEVFYQFYFKATSPKEKKMKTIMENAFSLPKKLFSFLRYSNFWTSLFPSFPPCWSLIDLQEKLIKRRHSGKKIMHIFQIHLLVVV